MAETEPILCGECYEKYHNIKIDDVFKYRWIEIIACQFCGSQPTIWFKCFDED